MTEKEKMLSGQLYLASDAELDNERRNARKIMRLFNGTTEEETEYRLELLRSLLQSTGVNLFVEPPFRCDYGKNIVIGTDFYANFDCIILDVCKVTIGNHVFLGPRVGIYTATHPVEAAARNSLLEYGRPVTICDNVWIGGNSVILPGVTIGEGAVIGAGSVVTKDVPKNVVAAGNPCRVLRAINGRSAI